jgi:hypothetical protein
LKAEGREKGELGVVAPIQGIRPIFKKVKFLFLLACYLFIFHGEFSNKWCKERNKELVHIVGIE